MTIAEMLNAICALEEAVLNSEDEGEKEALLIDIASIRAKLES